MLLSEKGKGALGGRLTISRGRPLEAESHLVDILATDARVVTPENHRMAQYDYSTERERYLPPTGVKVLFLGESAPDPSADQIRFFYHPVLRSADNLFRGIMLAVYGADRQALASTPKRKWLERFQSDGYYLEDLCALPVNHLPPAKRAQARRAAVPDLVRRVKALSPRGIIVCHDGTYRDIADHLRANHLPLLHREPIPFPLGNYRDRFREAVRAALSRLH
jgi:hypothetical protein